MLACQLALIITALRPAHRESSSPLSRAISASAPRLQSCTSSRQNPSADLGALPDEEIARPEDHGRRLLRLALHGDEPHGRTLGGFADCLGVGHVVLLPLDERLHVGRRDQPHLVAELADRASPVMRTRAGLHGDKAAGLARKERQYLLAPELLAEHDSAGHGRRSPSSPPCGPTASTRPGSSTARSTASSSPYTSEGPRADPRRRRRRHPQQPRSHKGRPPAAPSGRSAPISSSCRPTAPT